jgi:hypothetical protein
LTPSIVADRKISLPATETNGYAEKTEASGNCTAKKGQSRSGQAIIAVLLALTVGIHREN